MAVGSTGTLSSSSITVSVGESGQITWSGGAPQSIVSANANIATVTKSGLNSGTITVTGVSVGNTTATIQWAEGTSTISITVAASDDTLFLNKRGLAYFWDKIDTKKQNKLTAGSNITISGDTISASQPTVNNATLTIQKNGTNVNTFTANANSNVTANIIVPTKVSDLTNDSDFVESSDLATVATSGSYNDLTNKPTIPAAQVQSNWTQTTTTAVDYIKNKPTLATVATSGSYNDLSNKPTIPTVNNATLTIQKNGTNVQTFTANQSTNATANITVPTNTNELTNGAGFITSSGSITGNAATATKATQDSDGNAINTTYLKKSGGVMTGAITRALASSGTIADTNLFTVTGSTDGFGVNYSSTTADVGITTLYTTDDANAKLSLGNKISSTYKEAISIVNGSATVTGSVSGNAGTATKLETARTIGIGTGGTGTATSFNGTANITIPLTDVKDSYVTWGGKNIASNISPDDMGCIDEFGHNKLAFLPAECIEIKYSTDGGSTWADYGASDANKVKMVSTAGPGFYVGGSTDNATASNIANLKLRVRIAAGPTSGGKVYTAAKKILINVSTQGCSGSKVDIKYRTIANYKAGTETWTTVGTYDVAGGSGWNSIPFAYTFGGSFTSQTSQMGQIEFVFYSSGLGTWGLKKLSAIDFRMIGSTNWTMPSEMARAGHLYTVDEGQNATFPANVGVTGSLKHGSYTYTLPNKNGTVAMTSDIPSVPTVNNGTLTIQKNGSNVATFTANQSGNATANITVPTKTSDITNDSGFLTSIPKASASTLGGIKVGSNLSIDANGVLSAQTGSSYSAGNHIDITNGVISAEDYVHSEDPVSTGSITPVVTNGMVANGTLTASKFASGELLKLTMSTTDIGEGAALAANTLYGVYD